MGNAKPAKGSEALTAREADVIIVGAGLAGLSAARHLLAGGKSVMVLEAADRVGGRVLSRPVAEGLVVDLGGQWTGPGQQRLKDLARTLGVPVVPIHRSGSNVYYRNGRRIVAQGGRLAGDEVRLGSEVVAAVRQLDEMAAEVPTEAPWTARRAPEWDSQTFQTWMNAHLAGEEARTLVHLVIEGFLSDPRELSLLHTLFYAHANGGFASFFGLGASHDDEWFDGGAQLLALRMAQELDGRVLLSSPVRRISQGASGVEAAGDGSAVHAQRAIVAIPPALAGRIEYRPPLPPLRDLLTQRTPVRNGIKVQAVYDEPFWRAEGLSGQAISDTGPVATTLDSSPARGKHGVLTGFVNLDSARRLWRMPEGERKQSVLDSLVRFFGPRAAAPTCYLEQNWAAEEFSRGCVTILPPGAWTSYGPALRESVGRIHWAGTETATLFTGQMDGAIRSGERAAAEVLASPA